MDSLQKALGDKADQGEAIKDMQKQLDKLQQDAKAMADKSGAAAQEAKQELAKSLAELSRQAEAMDMIIHKIGRIINGNPDVVDHWLDIAGYAQLVADRLNGRIR